MAEEVGIILHFVLFLWLLNTTGLSLSWQNELERHRINELRRRFFHENGSNLHEFYEQDVKRVRDDDRWLSCFLKSRKQEVNDALPALVECVRWRKTFGVNELTERSIDRRLFEAGFLFPYNQDKDGNSLVMFTGKLYKKDPQQHLELKRYLVFILEKHARLFPGRKITMIFDMQETGLSNMDLEFVRFIISCFRDYFPWTLAWLIVVELPWILSAAWKIVKSWLSAEAVNKIRFLNKAELAELIDEDKLLIRLGGTKLLELVLTDNVEDVHIENGSVNQSVDFDDDSCEEAEDREEAPSSSTKKVTFEDVPTIASQGHDSSSSVTTVKQKCTFRALHSRTSQRRAPPDDFTNTASLLIITPSEEIVFTGTTSTGEILQSLSLANNSPSTVAFKVKTTSPESYRVRPSSGVIPATSSAEVSVFLQPGHAASVIRDKFLVMSTELQDEKSPSELAALWKTVPKANIIEHRLRCRFLASNSQLSSQYSDIAEGKPVTLSMAIDSIQSLQRQLNDVEKKLDVTNKRIAHIEEGLHVFIKVQLGLFSAMMVLFAIVMYYATYLM
ncbi:Motile sperm domain-containing protein 2 [Desmophyllum pertusum]|uniref:Motile sperm domain-containing protein 2 n=1 Tax=Desmophyllum pertusum TaxID=174260 RepID=A0A9W9YYF8_9CNID|nr:Motile sperm domain-containing protein 2 [Desmophyllum pertusum]